MNDLQKRVVAHRKKNPLYVWRTAKGLSRDALSLLIDSSMNSVVAWEKGGSKPTEQKINAIAHVMETDPVALRSRWEEWSKSMNT